MMRLSGSKGFTLIELMVVVVVLAILTALAYPSYVEYVRKARWSDAKQSIFNVASQLEQYYQDNKGYPSGGGLNDLGLTEPANTKLLGGEGYYVISSSFPSSTTYTLTATPIHIDQIKDKRCKSFTYDSLGNKGVGASSTFSAEDCW